MTSKIVITAEPRKETPISLVGKEYVMKPPKGAYAMKIAAAAQEAGENPTAVWEVLQGWIKAAFGAKQATAINKRLTSDDDDLDIPHIMELIQKSAEAQTGNPTT